MSVFFLLFTLAHEVRVEAHARIIDEHAAVDLPDIHLGDLPGEEITDGGLQVERNAGILGEMVQRTHRQNTERCLSTYELAGQCIDGPVASSGHDRVTALVQGAPHQSRDIVAALGHHNLHFSPDFRCDARNMRFRLLDVNGMAVEDACWA